jgi:hypothetical protein
MHKVEILPREKPRITPQAERLFNILQAAGGEWMSRRDIARALDRRKLAPYDIGMLDTLQAAGLIDCGKRPNQTPIGYEWVYRAVGET